MVAVRRSSFLPLRVVVSSTSGPPPASLFDPRSEVAAAAAAALALVGEKQDQNRSITSWLSKNIRLHLHRGCYQGSVLVCADAQFPKGTHDAFTTTGWDSDDDETVDTNAAFASEQSPPLSSLEQ